MEAKEKAGDEIQLKKPDVVDLDAEVQRMNVKLRIVDDCLERASGALEGQTFTSHRSTAYVEDQIDKAISFLTDCKVIFASVTRMVDTLVGAVHQLPRGAEATRRASQSPADRTK